MKQPDAKQTFTLVTTYGIGVLVLLEAGLAAIAPEVVRLMTTTEFYGAAAVIPWIGARRGVQRRLSADVDRPEHHQVDEILSGRDRDRGGAAASAATWCWSRASARSARRGPTRLAYAVLAVVAMRFSQRVYPVKYEWGRLARLAIAGGGAFAIALARPAT